MSAPFDTTVIKIDHHYNMRSNVQPTPQVCTPGCGSTARLYIINVCEVFRQS